jgi:tetratricopeptide (TPR) repeat protein
VDEAFALMQTAYDALADGEPDADVALVAAQLARLAYFAGRPDRAMEAAEVALEMAEALSLPEVIAEALNSKAMVSWRRPHEAEAFLREALRVAVGHDLPAAALRAQFNLSGFAMEHSRFGEARAILDEALALARVRGDRTWEALVLGQLADVLVYLGEWDEAEARCLEAPDEPDAADFPRLLLLNPRARILIARGELEQARAVLEHTDLGMSSDRQTQASYLLVKAALLGAEGRPREALAAAEESLEGWRALLQFHYVTEALVEAANAAFALDDLERVEALVASAESYPPIQHRPTLDAQTARIGAVLAARRGEAADEGFERAARFFRELEMPFWLAVTLLEQAEYRVRAGRVEEGEPLLAEAGGIFERLRAEPWLRRVGLASAIEARVGA